MAELSREVISPRTNNHTAPSHHLGLRLDLPYLLPIAIAPSEAPIAYKLAWTPDHHGCLQPKLETLTLPWQILPLQWVLAFTTTSLSSALLRRTPLSPSPSTPWPTLASRPASSSTSPVSPVTLFLPRPVPPPATPSPRFASTSTAALPSLQPHRRHGLKLPLSADHPKIPCIPCFCGRCFVFNLSTAPRPANSSPLSTNGDCSSMQQGPVVLSGPLASTAVASVRR